MTTETLTPKQKEIKALKALYNLNGYFTDELGEGDLGEMIYNIENDHPIFMGTLIDNSTRISSLQGLNVELEAKVTELEAGNKSRELEIQDQAEEIKKLKDRIRKFMRQMIVTNNEMWLEDICEHEDIIRLKLEEGIQLTDADAEALLVIMDLAK